MRRFVLAYVPYLHWRTLLPFLLSAALLIGSSSPVAAQTAVQVVVSVRDGADRGMDQVDVSLRAADGALVGAGLTDRDGSVTLSVSPPASTGLRLHLQGVNATGTPLQLAATEREGIVIHLTGDRTVLALRVEDDGTVLPDPATMAEPAGAPLDATAAIPTSIPATPPPASAGMLVASPAPTVRSAATVPPIPTIAPVEFVDASGTPVASQPPTSQLPLLVALIVVGLGIITSSGLAWLRRRARAGVRP